MGRGRDEERIVNAVERTREASRRRHSRLALGSAAAACALLWMTVFWVNPDERAGLLHFGALVDVLPPGGPYWKWPVVDRLRVYTLATQVVDREAAYADIGGIITSDGYNSALAYSLTWREIEGEIPWRITNMSGTPDRLDAAARARLKAAIAAMPIGEVSGRRVEIAHEVVAQLRPEMMALYHVEVLDIEITNFWPDKTFMEATKVSHLGVAGADALAAYAKPLHDAPALLELQEVDRWDGHRSQVASPAASPLVTLPREQP